jgi:alkylated DNA repair dioxygenase AlkB
VAEQALLPLEFEPAGAPDQAAFGFDAAFATTKRIQLDATSWVDHVPGWLTGHDSLMRTLLAEAEWEQRERWMYTRMVTEPRLTAEYPVISRAPQQVLRDLAEGLAAHYGQPFTRLWMNWYRNNDDGTGWHADREASKLPEAIIPVLSLGAARRFLIRSAAGGSGTTIVASGGDLVVMGGRCQQDYQHSVPKQKTQAGARVSLNFSA